MPAEKSDDLGRMDTGGEERRRCSNGPNCVLSTPASPRTGSSVPRAVVVRDRPTMRVSRTSPVDTRAKANPSAKASDRSQPCEANRSGCPFTRFRSSSKPARNMRNVSPMSESAEITSSGCVNFNTSGPMSIPNPSSITTEGTRRPLVCSEMTGARTAAAAMRTRVGITATVTGEAKDRTRKSRNRLGCATPRRSPERAYRSLIAAGRLPATKAYGRLLP
jgi:hypothetical protein